MKLRESEIRRPLVGQILVPFDVVCVIKIHFLYKLALIDGIGENI